MDTIRSIVIGIAATIVLLLVGAALVYPEQSPIMPIQVSVVLALLAGWLAWRRSRAALRVVAWFCGLLAVFGLHPFVGDLGTMALDEVVPDVLIVLVTAATAVTAVRVLRIRRRVPA